MNYMKIIAFSIVITYICASSPSAQAQYCKPVLPHAFRREYIRKKMKKNLCTALLEKLKQQQEEKQKLKQENADLRIALNKIKPQ